jgi:uncharacterized protein
MPNSRKLAAYILPIGLFVGLLALNSGLKHVGQSFWLASAEYWIYPTQTILCGAVLIWFRRQYDFNRLQRIGFALLIGVVAVVFWTSPQQFLGFPPRTVGFNPDLFAADPVGYRITVIFRFLRFAVVVPFVEEIFWRGLMLRFLINEDFERVPFGTFSWVSFVVVTLGFGFSHSRPDWIAAIVTGILYNAVAYRTKSLASCILTHAVTNLLLGIWIMTTKQWGFW